MTIVTILQRSLPKRINDRKNSTISSINQTGQLKYLNLNAALKKQDTAKGFFSLPPCLMSASDGVKERKKTFSLREFAHSIHRAFNKLVLHLAYNCIHRLSKLSFYIYSNAYVRIVRQMKQCDWMLDKTHTIRFHTTCFKSWVSLTLGYETFKVSK